MDSMVRMPDDDTSPAEFEDLVEHTKVLCRHLSRVVVDRDNYIQQLDDLNEAKKTLEVKIV